MKVVKHRFFHFKVRKNLLKFQTKLNRFGKLV